LPAKSLPEGVLSHRKTGFSIPVREWMLAAMGTPERGLRGWARVLHGYHGNDESESMRT